MCHDQKATLQTACARAGDLPRQQEGAPLEGLTWPKAEESLRSDRTRRLTFDMSGGAKGAKRPLGRPLDGRAKGFTLMPPSISNDWVSRHRLLALQPP